ncbi:MAG TPA: RES family NAD+ phosphorylase [Acidimicrobiia bacterium]|nr:RES family NAD+ phosphorylase [Acidimicrobiia bacterium]
MSRPVWRQTRPRAGLLDVSDPAPYAGRYHRTGGPGTWYASFTERGAWAELFRHWGVDEISPFEIRRRVGRAQVQDLAVLDLTSADVRAALGVEEAELIGNDWSRCQQLADDARAAGFDGLLAPSGALPGEMTLVVFAHALAKVTAEHSRVQRPPIRMLDVLTAIRLPDAAVEQVGRLYAALASLARRLRHRR